MTATVNASDRNASPVVSIVIPVYNAGPDLQTCLDAVLGQDERALELVAVDDGSTDGSGQVLAECAGRDPRLRVVRHPGDANRGVAASRNLGLSVANGEYLWFVDADDRVRPGAITTLLAAAREHRTDVLAFNGEECGGGLPPALIHRQPKPAGVVAGETWVACCCRQKEARHFVWLRFYRRAYLEDCRLRFREGIVHEDIAWITEGDLRAPRLLYLDAVLYEYARNPASLTRREDDAALLHRAESVLEVVAQLREINTRCPMQDDTRALLRAELAGQGVHLDRLRRRIGDAALRAALDRRLERERFWRSLWKDAVGYTRKRQIARILLRESLGI